MHVFYNDVNDWLSVGGDLDFARDLTGKSPAETVAQLQTHGVTHVLDARSEWSDAEIWGQAGVRYCHAPITDSQNHTPSEDWYTTVEMFVAQFIASHKPGDRLYMGCHMGVNRGPSAALVAMLVANPALDPYEAFLRIRGARPVAGLIYAEHVGRRHLRTGDDDLDFAALAEFNKKMDDYWTTDRIQEVNRGIAYFRTQEGGTLAVNSWELVH